MQLFYTVRPGDTLYNIAKRWQLPVETLIAASNVSTPDTIFIGQQLSIPPGVDVVRVKRGDTVYQLANAFGISQGAIIEANQLRPPYVIQVGQLLTIPQGVPYYVVSPGDTLYGIAKRYNVVTRGHAMPELIKQVNQLPSTTILPGMKLKIPFAPPGEDGLIAYNSNRGGSYDIWLYRPETREHRRITNGLGEPFSVPFWSPDSKKIAFVGKNAILYVIHIRDNSIAQIDQFLNGWGVKLDWSPQSNALGYTKNGEIVLYNIVTHQPKRMSQPQATDVQWFPNGIELLFQASDPSGISQLFRIRTDGTGKQQITKNTNGPLHEVRLSDNGMFALYTTPGVSISIIHTVELATGQDFEVSGGPLAKNYFPVWSPDSSNIAYSATAFEDRGYFSLIRIAGKRGEEDRTLAISDCFATPVAWSPDGRKVGYLSGCNEQGVASELWLLDLDHPVPIQLLKGVPITSLQWSPKPIPPASRMYRNTVFNVQFQYPAHWLKVNEERYEGPDGFFQIGAISAESSINEVCQNEAFHELLPYGSQPQIKQTTVHNQKACFITPSNDQPKEMRGQAALIVHYPKPIQIEGTVYQYFILWTDKEHLTEITSTFLFID